MSTPELQPQNFKPGSSESGGLVSGFTAYPQNLRLADVAYYMLAPTLTYQLNFPRMKRRRLRLLRRWVSLLLGTLLLMSFMQVNGNRVESISCALLCCTVLLHAAAGLAAANEVHVGNVTLDIGRRVRLLRRRVSLLPGTLLLMSFMQVN
jgi:hypothetical protein